MEWVRQYNYFTCDWCYSEKDSVFRYEVLVDNTCLEICDDCLETLEKVTVR
jgi:hypothetical protein